MLKPAYTKGITYPHLSFGYVFRGDHVERTPLVTFEWPEACPWTAEEVRAACKKNNFKLLSVPSIYPKWDGTFWKVLVEFSPGASGTLILTPGFMGSGNTKPCEHDIHCHYKCMKCGEYVNDRRKQQRRSGNLRRNSGQGRRDQYDRRKP